MRLGVPVPSSRRCENTSMTDWAAGVVLIFVAAGDPKDALTHQGLYGVLHGAAPPLGHAGGQRAQSPTSSSASPASQAPDRMGDARAARPIGTPGPSLAC